MEPHEVTSHVRERLGMETQAVSLVRARARGGQTPRVWAVMTEYGHFWLVEGAGEVELFRAVPARASVAGAGCTSAAEAVRRFLELHPEVQPAGGAPNAEVDPGGMPSRSGSNGDDMSFICQGCGVSVTRRRRTDALARQLCKRCRHAERERLRYHDDPQYRARRLAYSAARYRQTREGEPIRDLPPAGDARGFGGSAAAGPS